VEGIHSMFNKRPLNPVRNVDLQESLHSGFDALLQKIENRLTSDQRTFILALDGTHGADFQKIFTLIRNKYEKDGCIVDLINTGEFLKSGEELRSFFKKNITDNRAFGYVAENNNIEDYFNQNAQKDYHRKYQSLVQEEEAVKKRLIVVWGVGAYWISQGNVDLSMYLDVSREYQEVKQKDSLFNFGFDWNKDAVEKYKISFFVEWPILEGYRKENLSHFDYYVDFNDEDNPKVVTVSGLFRMIKDISKYPMRVKPFFASGVWGGQRLKKLANLPETMVNCAWSFEPIAPENSILMKYENQVIEVPFLVVMSKAYTRILGERIVRLFGDFFPIRFDYLDTMDGQNLSCQVHPKQQYIRGQFNEFLEQQESYYIMEKKGDSKVYLGLTEECTKDSFKEVVDHSEETGNPIEFTDYVQEWPSEKGDLFLIPTGTVHCSGKDNLVLEVSATSWWFTFKIYDYVRKDLDGNPRPINIAHAFDNIDDYKKTNWVKDNLIQEPILLRSNGRSAEYQLGKRDDLLFYVNRIHVQDEWQDDTNSEVLLLNLVEGEKVRIVSTRDESVFVEFEYAESYILPAAFGEFNIINLGSKPCKLIKAGVSPDWDVNLWDE
jgi:mannose-6-phosphate isomerase class I